MERNDSEKCLLLHIVPAYAVGGVELAAETAARESAGRLRTHFLSVVRGQPVPHSSRWITHGPQGSPAGFRATVAAMRHIRQADPEVVVFSLWRSLPSFLATKILYPRKKLVTFLHSERSFHRIDDLAARVMIPMSDQVWGDSGETLIGRRVIHAATRVVSMLLRRTTYDAAETPRPPQAHFVSWSRLNKEKRIDLSIHFISKLKTHRPEVRYTVIGPDAGHLEELQALVKQLSLGDSVMFVGPKDRTAIEAAAANATFYLQLSPFEGRSMAIMEAMQLGLVPVVTPVGGIPGYAVNGESAIFVQDVTSAAAAVNALLANPSRLARMSQAARAKFFSAKTYTEDLSIAAACLAGRTVAAQ